MPVTFAEDAAGEGEEAKASDVTRVTPDEKDSSARCETVKKVATELASKTYPDYTKECVIFFASLVGSIIFLSLLMWASTPSFLTGSLSTNNTPSKRDPDSPTEVTTEQPRPTTFDSVPSIPSDLF